MSIGARMKSRYDDTLPSVAVVGSGYWGRNLVRNFKRIGALRAICDKDEVGLRAMMAQHPGVDACLALSDLLGRSDIKGIAIATPAETHFNLAREALLAGKHVLVEKPLVLHEAQGLELIEIANRKNLVLMVGHLLQYHPAFISLKEKVITGELGRINYVYSHRLNLGKIRREENILWSFAPHDVSMILSLAGSEPESLMTTGAYYLHERIADVTTTHLEFPGGLHAHIFVSWLHPFKEQKLVVVGDKKMAVFDDTLSWPDKLLIYPHHLEWLNGVPVPAKAEPQRVETTHEEPLWRECLHFLECISSGLKPLTDGKEGIRVLRVLNASQKSLDNNGKKIRIEKRHSTSPAEFFVHGTAILDHEVTIGAGTKIWHFSHILAGSRIGKGCNIGQNVVIGPDVTIEIGRAHV